jgi:hypothetical protein
MSLIGPTLSLILFYKLWRTTRHQPSSWQQTLSLALSACIVVILALSSVFLSSGYANDSLWTLGWGGRIGVVAISLIGLAGIFTVLAFKSRALGQSSPWVTIPLDIIAGMLIYLLALWLSPQVFYTFYQTIFTDLPVQIVIKSPFDLNRLQQILIPVKDGSLANHLASIGFWAVLPFTIWQHANRLR